MNRVDIAKVYRENVKPYLTAHEASVMEHSLAAPPLRSLITQEAGQVYWYVFDSPLPRSKRHGVTSSMLEAQDIVGRVKNAGLNDNLTKSVN